MLTYQALKNRPRELLAASGLSPAEFEKLLPMFEEGYRQRYRVDQTVEGQARQRRAGGGSKGKLSAMADRLLFILVYTKTYPLQT
ncbi:MAG: hypothetical protein ACYDBJ_29465, partial [Aggregatilineales bacterium]